MFFIPTVREPFPDCRAQKIRDDATARIVSWPARRTSRHCMLITETGIGEDRVAAKIKAGNKRPERRKSESRVIIERKS